MPQASQKVSCLALRSPALLVAATVVHGDCSNISQTLFPLIRNAGWYSDNWPTIVDFPKCFGRYRTGTTVVVFCHSVTV